MMNEQTFKKELMIRHLLDSSIEDQKAMYALFDAKSYSWSLFIGHISIEKYLKAIYIQIHSKNAPFTHNLLRLAEQCNLELNDEISDKLDFITTFNIEARYDDYKKEFNSICTLEFTKTWLKNIEEILEWLKRILY